MKIFLEKTRTLIRRPLIWINKRIADAYANNNGRWYKLFDINGKLLILSVKDIDLRKMQHKKIEKKMGRKFIKGVNFIELDQYLIYTAKPKNTIV